MRYECWSTFFAWVFGNISLLPEEETNQSSHRIFESIAIFFRLYRYHSEFHTIKISYLVNRRLLSVPLDRYESYFIPGCNEIYMGTALVDDSGSDSTGDRSIRPWKRYIL